LFFAIFSRNEDIIKYLYKLSRNEKEKKYNKEKESLKK